MTDERNPLADERNPLANAGGGDESEPAEPEPQPLEVGPDVRLAERANPAYVRRAPRFGAFLFAGLFLAALIAGLASFVRDSFLPVEQMQGRALDSGGMFLLLFLILAAFFSLGAYGIAVALDRRSTKRMLAARASSESAGDSATSPTVAAPTSAPASTTAEPVPPVR